jgi:DHA2 family multidrug resistance protein
MNNRVFYDWVSPKLDLWLLLFLSIILSFNVGIQSTISVYVMGSQSAIPADLAMAGFAYFSGMACALPFTLRVQRFSSRKTLFCLIFPAVIFLNFILSVANQPLVMVMTCFAIGFIKMIATLMVVLALFPILMPKGERYQLYCMYYPLSLVFGPLSGLIAAYLSGYWNWKFSFHAQNLFLFAGLLVVIAFVNPRLKGKKIPLYQYDWMGTILLAAFMLLASYIFAYGVTEDWFASVKIQAATAGALVAFALFLQLSIRIKRPVFKFGFLSHWKPVIGVVLLFTFCLFFNTTALVSPFLDIILKNNPLESAQINTYVIPGYLTGTLLCFIYYRKFTNFNAMAAVACASYLVSNLLMYRLTSSFTGPSDLFPPMYFRAMATVITYISAGVYITTNIPVHFLDDITFVIIALRSLGAPIVASAIYSNWLYRGQVRHVNSLANDMDSMNLLIMDRSAGIITSVKTQASLLAIRDIYGVLIVAGIVLLVFIIVFPFHGSDKRTVIDWKNPFYGREAAQAIPM